MEFNSFDILLDILDKLHNKKVIIFGTGKAGKKIFFLAKHFLVNTAYFVDNDTNKWESNLFEVKICNPKILLNESEEDIIILIASIFDEEIKLQLDNMGFKKNKHYYSLIIDSEKAEKERIEKSERELIEKTKKAEKERYDKEFLWHSDENIIKFPFKVGRFTYGHMDLLPHMRLERIGAFCAIGPDVKIGANNH
ncbi:MAG: hypothetical protein PHC34_04645 [Candidatus Gastranaerophilales bacterium]|nr:hypothetical protein [Candidatus Gastranaerophilales bacterium]